MFYCHLYLASEATPREFSVDFDTVYDKDDDNLGQFKGILYDSEMGFEKNDVIHFIDQNSEQVFLRAADAAMIEIPLWVIQPELLDDETEM